MTSSICYFNKIAIIESLPDGDEKTGKKLYEDILPINYYNNEKIIIAYCATNSIADLSMAFNQLKEDAQTNNVVPIIHFECHGSDKGITLANDEFVSWEQLNNQLKMLNEATRFNLIVSLAACYTFKFAFNMYAYERAPFWGILAPTEVIYPDELKKAFFMFYKSLIESTIKDDGSNGSIALELLRTQKLKYGSINFINADYFFSLAFNEYMQNERLSKTIKKRAQYICNKLYKMGQKFPISDVKRALKNLEYYYLEKFHKTFFMTDLFPENSGRFEYIIKYMVEKYSLNTSYDDIDELSLQVIRNNDKKIK